MLLFDYHWANQLKNKKLLRAVFYNSPGNIAMFDLFPRDCLYSHYICFVKPTSSFNIE